MNARPALAALLALAGAAHAQSDFAVAAGRDVWDVARFNPPEFALTLTDASMFAFYGEGGNPLQAVKCERSAGFGFIAQASQAGGILVGMCAAEAQRVRALALKAQPALEALLAQLGTIDRAALQKAGWTYTKSTGTDGAEEYSFPVLAVGHGILGPQTVVRVPHGARRAIIVQADTTQLCEDHYRLKTKTPLCIDTRKALADIARRLEARFPN